MPMTMLIFVNYAHLIKTCRNYALLFTLNLVKTPLYKLYNKQVNGKHIYSVYTIRVYVRFPFSPKFRKFRLEIKWNGSFWFGPTGIFGTTFDRSAHFRQIGLKGPFPFDKIIVPSATFLHPSYKNNIQTRGGLGPVCATGMHRSMDSIGHGISKLSRQTGIFVERKAPHNLLLGDSKKIQTVNCGNLNTAI